MVEELIRGIAKWPDDDRRTIALALVRKLSLTDLAEVIAAAHTRIPAGHPEGYLEAFANIYRNFANHLRAVIDGNKPDDTALDYPKITDGIRGMAFIEAAVDSSKHNARWTKLDA